MTAYLDLWTVEKLRLIGEPQSDDAARCALRSVVGDLSTGVLESFTSGRLAPGCRCDDPALRYVLGRSQQARAAIETGKRYGIALDYSTDPLDAARAFEPLLVRAAFALAFDCAGAERSQC